MANEMKYLNGIKAKDASGVTHEYGLMASAISGLTGGSGSVTGLWVNPSNNLELNSNPGAISGTPGTLASDSKLNLVSADAVQIKPGKDASKTDTIQPLQLDAELGGTGCTEYPIKVCNGGLNKAARVIATKLNTSELIIDTQKAEAGADVEEFNVKFRYDKKDHPIYAKFKGRAFDFRCLDHGGIALQIAGQDSDNHENKVKFESDRTSEIGATPVYCGEGGKGVEFGTFNTEHASLYVGDYRFKGDAKVYGVTRGAITTYASGKKDYPKQADDFQDIVNTANCATWNDMIGVANAYVDNGKKLGGVTKEEMDAAIARAQLSGFSADTEIFVTKDEVKDVVASALSEYEIELSGVATEQWVKDQNYLTEVPEDLALLGEHARITDSGNMELFVNEEDTNLNMASAKNIKLNAAAKVRICSPSLDFDYELSTGDDNVTEIDGADTNLTYTFKNRVSSADTAFSANTAITVSEVFNGTITKKYKAPQVKDGVSKGELSLSVPVRDVILGVEKIKELLATVNNLTSRIEVLEAALEANHPIEPQE